MEQELNYLSEKIEKLERSMQHNKVTITTHYSLQNVRNERQMLENILNKLTEAELTCEYCL